MSINAHDEPKHACRIGIQVLPLYFISVVGPAAAALGASKRGGGGDSGGGGGSMHRMRESWLS